MRVCVPGGFEVSGEFVQWRGEWVPRRQRSISWRDFSLGWTCSHRRMRSHCHPKECGHLECLDCGLFWDEGAES